jgi:predicted nucleic acid-binding protein
LTRIVVDASVVLAGLFKDGTVRDLILNLTDVELCAPAYLREETFRQVSRVASRAKLSETTVRTVLEDLFGAVELIPAGVYSGWMERAEVLAKEAAAEGDSDYIALTLALDAPMWTLDRDLRRVPGLRILATADMKALPGSEV